MSSGFAKRLIAVLAAAAFGLVIAFAVTMAINVVALNDDIQKLDAAQQRLTSCLESFDVEGAYQASVETSDLLAHAEDQLAGVQWNLLKVLPVIGDDVRCAEGLVQICNDLVEKAVRPLLGASRSLTNDEGQLDLGEALSMNPVEGLSLVAAVSNTGRVVSDCRDRIAALPEPHNDELKKAKRDLETSITGIAAAFDTIGSVLGGSA